KRRTKYHPLPPLAGRRGKGEGGGRAGLRRCPPHPPIAYAKGPSLSPLKGGEGLVAGLRCSTQMALLEIADVSKRFGATVAVDDVSLSIEGGALFALLGPSGCGKTTLLRMIAGFETPERGRILIDGADVT